MRLLKRHHSQVITMASVTTESSGDDIYMFEPSILEKLSVWPEIEKLYLEKNWRIRPLKLSDYPDYMDPIEFEKEFYDLKARGDYIHVLVENISDKRIVGRSILTLELKFIHQCATRGRLEEISLNYEKHPRIWDLRDGLIKIMVELARDPYNCYKLSFRNVLDADYYVKEYCELHELDFRRFGFSRGPLKMQSHIYNPYPVVDFPLFNSTELFDQQILTKLSKWKEFRETLESKNLLARPLTLNDFDNGYLDLLEQLTSVGCVTKDKYDETFHKMQTRNQIEPSYAILVIEDLSTKKIVGATTLFITRRNLLMKPKWIIGRIEDVAVLETYRHQKIGLLVCKIIRGLAQEIFKCHRLELDCEPDLERFYRQIGLGSEEVVLSKHEDISTAHSVVIRFTQ